MVWVSFIPCIAWHKLQNKIVSVTLSLNRTVFLKPLGRLGAEVLGIDAVQESIQIAEEHKAEDSSLSSNLQYKCILVEDLVQEKAEYFDVVIASEIVEHVADVDAFTSACCKLVKVRVQF